VPKLQTKKAARTAASQRLGAEPDTGRLLITFKDGAADAGLRDLRSKKGLRVANARDFDQQAFGAALPNEAEAVIFSEIGVALVGAEAAASRKIMPNMLLDGSDPAHSVDPEHFALADAVQPGSDRRQDYLRGFIRMTQVINEDLDVQVGSDFETVFQPTVLGVTWGLTACKVPASPNTGNGIKVAVVGGGFDLGHPDFAGRHIVFTTFAGSQIVFANSDTHITGTACGPKAPLGPIPRYGIGVQTDIFIAKVLGSNGAGTQAQILAGINWGVANRCEVILVSPSGGTSVQPSYTAAGAAALAKGCLIVAGAGFSSHRPQLIAPAAAPANSPTIVSVGAVDRALNIAAFSPGGKIDIAGPGVNVFSALPSPALHGSLSGSSMAAAHVAGCAALWAQVSPALRGSALRAKLFATAKHLPFSASDVGAGLVQAP